MMTVFDIVSEHQSLEVTPMFTQLKTIAPPELVAVLALNLESLMNTFPTFSKAIAPPLVLLLFQKVQESIMIRLLGSLLLSYSII